MLSGIQLFGRLSALDVSSRMVATSASVTFGIPGAFGIDHDGRSLFAGAQAGRTGDQHFAWHNAALHETHVEGHQQLCRTLAAAGRFQGPGGRALVQTRI